MHRRHFIKLSAATGLALLYSRISYAHHNVSIMTLPDEVYAMAGNDWVKLTPSGNLKYTYRDIEVSIERKGDASRVFVQSPTLPLFAIRLKWKFETPKASKVLGDSWERTYGDAGWKTPDSSSVYPWYALLYDGRQTVGFGVKTGCSSLCWWGVNADSIALTMNTLSGGNGVLLGSRKLHAADVITTKSIANESPFATARRFCGLMCEHPRLPKQPVYGINDWYYAYGNNSPKLIKEQTALMAELVTDTQNRPFSVIDAGWAQYSPYLPNDGGWQEDFSKPNDKFKDMHLMANDVKKLGMRPGLWMRPLCGKHDESASLLAPKIPGRDDPNNPVLDPTIPENIERVKHDISLYRQWGYEMVKHDYSTYDIFGHWGSGMLKNITAPNWNFYNKELTNAEIVNNLYGAIREAAGDMYIIGCNTLSHLSAGVFELNRIGDDTSGREWDRTRKFGVNTLGFRMVQHNKFYAADGDCVGLTTDISWKRNKLWLELLAESSAPLFISAQPDALHAEQKAFIKECFAKAAKPQPIAEPLDWLTNNQPAKWKLDNKIVDFDWA